MSHIAYVNGVYTPHCDAAVHIEDRGYQFADGVYEVIAVYQGIAKDLEEHLIRLDSSLSKLSIPSPMSKSSIRIILNRIIHKNHIDEGLLYIQITRGQARRNHSYTKDMVPSLVITARSTSLPPHNLSENGVSVITYPDIRWKRCDIKSLSLLPNVLAKQEAKDKNAFEAIFVDDSGYITEGSSSNVWIVSNEGKLITRHIDNLILSGVTRHTLINFCIEKGLEFEEKSFSRDEAINSKEVFLTSTGIFILPVISIDNNKIGSGMPGSIFKLLNKFYIQHMKGPKA